MKRHFRFDGFRAGQREVIEKLLAGNDVLAVMPTGQGKSLCYQLPALLLPGVTIVISPLVALMKDQVDALHGMNLRQATFINSQLSFSEQRRRIAGMAEGKYKLVYVAPERLRSRAFLAHLAGLTVSLLAVDEAHCISAWGHDFRPDYLGIREFRRQLSGNPRVLALTATATPSVQGDIIKQLDIPAAAKVVTSSDRPNLCYTVKTFAGTAAKLAQLRTLLAGKKDSGLIYVATRKEAEKLAAWLADNLAVSAVAYHAGLEPEVRNSLQEAFLESRVQVIVGTNAFGMGIDKPDIRFVIHYNLPGSLEAYYQEVGRAGRDGRPADCVLFFTHRDQQLQEWIINNETLTRDDITAFWQALKSAKSAPGENNTVVLTVSTIAVNGFTEIKLRLLISMLERLEVLSLEDRDKEQLHLTMGPRQPSRAMMNAVLQQVGQRAAAKREKLATMVRWIHTSRCRRTELLGYFGEEPRGRPSRCCDNCIDRTGRVDSTLPLTVFKCIKELPRPLGAKKLVDVLRGSQSGDILQGGYHKTRAYGKLSALSATAVRGLVSQLIGDGYLRVTRDEYPVVVLTDLGRKALQDGLTIPVRAELVDPPEKESTAPANDGKPADVDQDLLGALKRFRTELAGRESLPPFMLFHDRVLKEIAARKPVTIAALAAINGMGEKKLAKYGEQLIDIIKPHTVSDPKSQEPHAPEPPNTEPASAGEDHPATGKDLILDKVEGLFRQGLAVSDIAARLDLAFSGVEDYLAALVASNRIAIDDLVPWPTRKLIYRAMEKAGIQRLAPIKRLLPEDVPYSAIRYVRACLQKDPRSGRSAD